MQARALRESIPKILEPLAQKQASRTYISSPPALSRSDTLAVADVLYQAVMKAVNDSQVDITEFTALMNESESKAVLARAEKSRQEDPTDIKPWRHKDHPDWYDLNGKA